MTTIENNLGQIHARMAAACASASRPVTSVQLLAVSKTFGAAAVREAVLAGQRSFGENYIQEAVEKIAAVRAMQLAGGEALQWHCIGPIQSNKTRLVAENFDWAQTVDRLKIAERLSAQRPQGMARLNVCIQVNVDGGATKSGVMAEQALELAQAMVKLPNLQLRGIMSIPDDAPDFEAQCAVHKKARAVFESIKASGLAGLEYFDTLSMGMTGDLEAAVAAGSTMVRVGSGIFGRRTYGTPTP
ncbi:YggS family pyridoxal phosphate-dependent enzyme [Comamonas thiooxydans]|uniref:YggS family pyridoxal phosphate-dependent enzyme n=1 Tax=Comamonas thiooxydans TaxID=363952 RepID=UPI001CCCF538|nr:YggS family pyridoxal phosphate-dependent enzyme [Comamonas thiooxydans]MCO8248152.1 YggS family pyridoxal phosphate-dependent enzyme [Comamonas thiooxydans]UBQ41551.1 YggS family pyridoxal phosphate-dependent enzyme [Comamonas thiooxydans]